MANILAFGEVMMRLMVPDNKKMFQTNTLEYIFSGTGVNILSGLSHFSHNTNLLTKLPNNMIGKSAKSYINSLGVGTASTVFGDDYIGMYFLENGFGDRPSVVTYTNRLESSFCRALADDYDIDEALSNIDLVHFCGISLGVSKNVRDTLYKIMEKAKEKGIKIAFDFNFRSSLWESYDQARPHYEKVLEYSDIVFLTERDGKEILNLTSSETDEDKFRKDIFDQLYKKYNIEFIAGTKRFVNDNSSHKIQGFIYSKENIHYSKKYEFKVLDRIGGGDGFVSGILHGILLNYSLEKTVEFGVGSGVLAHMTYGDSPISSILEVESFLNNNNKDICR